MADGKKKWTLGRLLTVATQAIAAEDPLTELAAIERDVREDVRAAVNEKRLADKARREEESGTITAEGTEGTEVSQ